MARDIVIIPDSGLINFFPSVGTGGATISSAIQYESGGAINWYNNSGNLIFAPNSNKVGVGVSGELSAKLEIYSSQNDILRANGANGSIFGIQNDLNEILLSVNNSSGLPVLEIFPDDRVKAGEYGLNDFIIKNNNIGIGTGNPDKFKLQVLGSIGPETNNSYDLGSSSYRWKDGYFSGTIDILNSGADDYALVANLTTSATTSYGLSIISTVSSTTSGKTAYGVYSKVTPVGAAASSSIICSYNELTLGASTTTTARGSYSLLTVDGASTGTSLISSQGAVSYSSNATHTNAIGANGTVLISGTGLTNAYAVRGVITYLSGDTNNSRAGYFSSDATGTASYGIYSEVTGAATSSYAGFFTSSGAGTTNYGVYINTVTNATTNYSLFNNSAQDFYLGANRVSVLDSTPTTGELFLIGGAAIPSSVSATTAYGLIVYPTWTTTQTVATYSGAFQIVTPNSSYTLTSAYGVGILAPSKGASNTITNSYGLSVANQGISGTTTSYGLSISAQSGSTNNYAIHTAGTADMVYIGGKVGIGVSGNTTYQLHNRKITESGLTSDVTLTNIDNAALSFDATAAVRNYYALSLNATATRSAGSNAVSNFALSVAASGAQNNYAIYVSQGNVNLQTLDVSKVVFTDSSKNLTTTGTIGVASGGTGATTFTEGSVVFAGGSGVYTEDNSKFFWDNSSNILRIGTPSTVSTEKRLLVYHNGSSAYTASSSAVVVGETETFNTTGGTLSSIGIYALNGSTRSSGANPLFTYGIYTVSTSGQSSWGIYATSTSTGASTYGGEFLNSGNGTTNCAISATVTSVGTTNYGLLVSSSGSTTNYSILSTSGHIKNESTASSVICQGAALATNATDGFLYLPTCAGLPTGVPTTQTGTCALVFDTTNNKLYVYDSSWIAIN